MVISVIRSGVLMMFVEVLSASGADNPLSLDSCPYPVDSTLLLVAVEHIECAIVEPLSPVGDIKRQNCFCKTLPLSRT